jgi:hypothetical protein
MPAEQMPDPEFKPQFHKNKTKQQEQEQQQQNMTWASGSERPKLETQFWHLLDCTLGKVFNELV